MQPEVDDPDVMGPLEDRLHIDVFSLGNQRRNQQTLRYVYAFDLVLKSASMLTSS